VNRRRAIDFLIKSELLVAGLSGLIALLASNHAHAFTVFPAHHQNMTRQALAPGNYSYQLPNGSVQVFDSAALTNIEDGNFNIDLYSTTSKEYDDNYHFDDERFAIGQKILLATRDQIIVQLSDEAFRNFTAQDLVKQTELSLNSRELLGNALHTLQDYYSHSNWLEQQLLLPGSPRLNLNVGAKGKNMAAPTDAQCSDDSPGEAMHTSGDYFASGVTDCTFICAARPGKCAHGNVLDSVALLALSLKKPECAVIDPDCGLNKDRGFRDGHPEAYELAKQHTALFVTEIFKEALRNSGTNENSVALAICQFMGVPDAINTCLTKNTLTVQKINRSGGGAVTQGLVKSTNGNLTPAIDCGLLCEGTAIAGSSVQLKASNAGNWRFVRWEKGGDCSKDVFLGTTSICSLDMSGNLLVKPEFGQFDNFMPMSPKATFLRSHSIDPTLDPVIIDLGSLGIAPGQLIELVSLGEFSWYPGGPDYFRKIITVFSSSNELLPYTELHRVPGALAVPGQAYFTTPTCANQTDIQTDIPEDFEVYDSLRVTVPPGALYLFAGISDCYFAENSDPNGDLGIAIRRVGSGQGEFVDWSSINHGSRIVSGMLDQSSVTFQWTADGGVSATWFNQNLHGFSSSAFTPALESTDGLEFRARKLPDPTPTYTITFSAPVLNPLLHIASNASTLTFVGATPTYVSGDERFLVSGSQVIGSDHNEPNGTDANGTVQFWGLFTSLTFTAQYLGTGTEDGVALQVGKDAP
jgi:hypothetical protein